MHVQDSFTAAHQFTHKAFILRLKHYNDINLVWARDGLATGM